MEILSIKFVIFLLAISFLYYFVNLINRILKKNVVSQWWILLIASLIFYGLTNYLYLVYIGISAIVSYGAGFLCQNEIFLERTKRLKLRSIYIESHKTRKRYENSIACLAIIINLGILVVLKYYNFFIGTINSTFNMNFITYNFVVPLGISFYTFSLISYNVDCCKRTTKAENNPFKFLLYVSYFPKIFQGPISSYGRLKNDGLFDKHRFRDMDFLRSFYRISVGLVKKIAIANVLNVYVNYFYSNVDNIYGLGLFLATILYSIQLYCDFSGFMDIVIGISGIFGIRLEENFNLPYLASSLQDFWRRWHITLGNWLKKYIYIPLGGNRVGYFRLALNILIVWLISGVWHGANWTFIIWGLFHGVLLAISGIIKKHDGKEKPNHTNVGQNKFFLCLKITGVFLLVNFGWVFFRSSNVMEAAKIFSHMVEFWKLGLTWLPNEIGIQGYHWTLLFSLLLIILLIGLSIQKSLLCKTLKNENRYKLLNYSLMFSVTIVFFVIAIFMFFKTKSFGGGESSFIYFDF